MENYEAREKIQQLTRELEETKQKLREIEQLLPQELEAFRKLIEKLEKRGVQIHK